jgi:hypothetical protein
MVKVVLLLLLVLLGFCCLNEATKLNPVPVARSLSPLLLLLLPYHWSLLTSTAMSNSPQPVSVSS